MNGAPFEILLPLEIGGAFGSVGFPFIKLIAILHLGRYIALYRAGVCWPQTAYFVDYRWG
jgi:hypothetical protein